MLASWKRCYSKVTRFAPIGADLGRLRCHFLARRIHRAQVTIFLETPSKRYPQPPQFCINLAQRIFPVSTNVVNIRMTRYARGIERGTTVWKCVSG
jgi:hypothetical protein